MDEEMQASIVSKCLTVAYWMTAEGSLAYEHIKMNSTNALNLIKRSFQMIKNPLSVPQYIALKVMEKDALLDDNGFPVDPDSLNLDHGAAYSSSDAGRKPPTFDASNFGVEGGDVDVKDSDEKDVAVEEEAVGRRNKRKVPSKEVEFEEFLRTNRLKGWVKLDEVPSSASSEAGRKRIRTQNKRLGEKYGTGPFKEMAVECDAEDNAIQVIKMNPGGGRNVEYSGANVRRVPVKEVVNTKFDGKDVCATKGLTASAMRHEAERLGATDFDLDPATMAMLLTT